MCRLKVVIQVLEFHNPMNIETWIYDNGNIEYCCCDKSKTCTSQAMDKNLQNCGNLCDPFFYVRLRSLQNEPFKVSSISTIEETMIGSPSHTCFIGYTLPFTLDEFSTSMSYAIIRCIYRCFENVCN